MASGSVSFTRLQFQRRWSDDAAIGVAVALLSEKILWLALSPTKVRRKRPNSAFTRDYTRSRLSLAHSKLVSCFLSFPPALTAPVLSISLLQPSLLTVTAMSDVMVRNSPLRRDPSFVIDNSFADSSWCLPLLAQTTAAEMGGQDPRADLGPAMASHGQHRPTSSEDSQSLRQHDEGTSRHETAVAPLYPNFFDGQCARMCCATPGRGFLGEKDARR
jgi:hypothetical protein